MSTEQTLGFTPPQDLEAEQAVLGSCLLLGRIPEEVEALTGKEFYRPAHEQLLDAMMSLAAAGDPVDPLLVLPWLTDRGLADKVGGAPYLHTLMAAVPVAANVGHYVAILLDRYQRRRELDLATRIQQRALSSEMTGEDRLEEAERELSEVPSRERGDLSSMVTLDQFLAQPLPPEDVLIPGILSRGDRLIVTAGEGHGKTTLMRQLALCAAGGVQPFSGRTQRPLRVLYVDCENPKRIMHHRFTDILRAVNVHASGSPAGRNVLVERRPGGLNLLDPAERRWLHRRMVAAKPDILFIGPIYKLHLGASAKEPEETQVRRLSATLDQLREEFDCGLVLEAHSAKGEPGRVRTVEPIGSSLWLRWPEFGVGLRPVDRGKNVPPLQAERERLMEVVVWKKRDDHQWPRHVMSSAGLPWVETVP